MPHPLSSPRNARRLFACLCALWALLPAPRALATSWECLRSGIEKCRDIPEAQGRVECLDAFLDHCSYYCGTVGDDCAKRRLAKTRAEEWRDAGRLSSWVANTCVVKPNCPPPKTLPLPEELKP
jgi:hypothetical protein